jgi:hypothetical protein
MTYYRLALLTPQTRHWCWKTTALTSLQTVFHWLRIYRAFPQDHLRVFSSHSKEGLEEMFTSEKRGVPSGSVSAAQFLSERQMQVPQRTPGVPMQKTTVSRLDPSSASATNQANEKHSTMLFLPKESHVSVLDQKRLELERGPGGDHNVVYCFSLPQSLPQVRAWIRLQKSACAHT